MLLKVPFISAVLVPANPTEPITRTKANPLDLQSCLPGAFDMDELPVLFEGSVYVLISDWTGVLCGLTLNERASTMVRDYVARHEQGGREWLVYGDGLLIEPRDSNVASVSNRADFFLDPRRR
jgi:hypothetical protein